MTKDQQALIDSNKSLEASIRELIEVLNKLRSTADKIED